MLFNNNYSLIITKGLGGPACCALITAPIFSLVCKCAVLPPPPPSLGGSTPVTLYTPVIMMPQTTRMVVISVTIKDECRWRKVYELDKRKADIVVEVINFVNVIKEKTNIVVSNVKQITRKVVAVFTDKYTDKE